MKKLKIFLASSEELKEERKELADLVSNLNHILSRRDIFVDLVKWEYLDASMGELHKQEEYNAELRDCELCIVLYWTRFGMYTKTELDTAYSELKSGHNPRKLYVYFKVSENPSEDLRIFKESFPNEYGHFSTDFGNIDTLKAHFLLQFLDYMSSQLKANDVLEIRDSQVKVNGQTFVNLSNVPFAGNNEEYNLLLKNIKKTKKLMAVSEPDDPEYSEYAQELQELEKKLSQMESSLWDTALMVTKLCSTRQSERLQRAMELFNSGDNKGAMAVLKEEDIDRDVQHNLHLLELGEEGKKGLKTNIEEYMLRIKTLKNDFAKGWGEEVLALHKKILEVAEKVYGEDSLEVASYHVEAAKDLSLLGNHKEALERGEKALITQLHYLGENHLDLAQTYSCVGHESGELGNHQVALEYEEKALQIRRAILGENNLDVAQSYNDVGYEYSELGEYRKALEYKKKALGIRSPILGENHPNMVESFINVGFDYGELGEYEKALEYLNHALDIGISLYGNIHNDVAIAYLNIGLQYIKLEDYNKALEYSQKALKIWQSLFGANHPYVALAYNNIGVVHSKLGDEKIALEYKEKALRMRVSMFGENHPSVAQSYNNIGQGYSKLGNHEQALKCQKMALQIYLNTLGENHPTVAVAYRNLGYDYGELGDHNKELEYCIKALEISHLIDNKNLEASFHNRVGTAYQRMSNIEQAREHFRHAAELFKELGNDKEYKANLELCKSLAKGDES